MFWRIQEIMNENKVIKFKKLYYNKTKCFFNDDKI